MKLEFIIIHKSYKLDITSNIIIFSICAIDVIGLSNVLVNSRTGTKFHAKKAISSKIYEIFLSRNFSPLYNLVIYLL
jgi:hypothetical protein